MRKKIRKNAFKYIASLMTKSTGVILRTCSSENYVDYDFIHSTTDTVTALQWLIDNQDIGQAYTEVDNGNETLVIRGPHHFNHVYVIYFGEAHFQADANQLIDSYILPHSSPEATEQVNPIAGYELHNGEDSSVVRLAVVPVKNQFAIASTATMEGKSLPQHVNEHLLFDEPAAAFEAIEDFISRNPCINAPSNLTAWH